MKIDDIDNQAASLREAVRKKKLEAELAHAPLNMPRVPEGELRKAPHTLAVTSGKGGVGKTLVTVNMAINLARQGKKVLVMDADLGLANIDVVLGLTPKYTVQDVMDGRLTLDDVAIEGPEGIVILPAATGVSELSNLDESQKLALMDHIDHWNANFDVVLVDTGAGISPNVLYFILAVEEVLVVVTPDPTSITDAYALIKVMFSNHRISQFNILVNQAKEKTEALDVFKTLHRVADRFLNVGLNFMGFIPDDPHLVRAVRQQQAVTTLYPNAPSTHAFAEAVEKVQKRWEKSDQRDGRMTFFGRRQFPG